MIRKLFNKFMSWDGLAPGEGGFVQAALMAAPYVLQGISALGGLFGKKKKHMDSEALRQMYGPRAIGKDTQELSNYILNSPYGQQLMASAAEQGQGLQTDMAARAAASGLSPDTGASSGASDFQVSAAGQAQTGLERGVKAGITQSAMPIAADLVGGRMQAALQAQSEMNAQPSTMQRIGAAAGQVAAAIPKAGAPPGGNAVAAPAPSLALQKIVPDAVTGAPALAAMQSPALTAMAAGPNAAPDQFSSRPKRKLFQNALVPNAASAGLTRRS